MEIERGLAMYEAPTDDIESAFLSLVDADGMLNLTLTRLPDVADILKKMPEEKRFIWAIPTYYSAADGVIKLWPIPDRAMKLILVSS